MSDKKLKNLELERNETKLLAGEGIEFSIDDVEVERKPILFGLLRKRVPKKIRRSFTIQEPTLGTLDRLSAEWVELAIDDEAMQEGDIRIKSKALAGMHTKRCAKIVAIAVIGNDYLVPKVRGGGIIYKEDKKELARLTDLFLRSVKPSDLYKIAYAIEIKCNLVDFMSSIRLMSSDRTAMPNRVEESKGV